MKAAFALIKVVIIAIIGLFARKSGKDAVLAGQAKDAARRSEEGRKAAGQAAQDIRGGKAPDDVLRANDGDWGR